MQDDWNTRQGKNYDILFIGNSRVWSQVNSELISKSLHLKVFNLTQDGRGIDLLWAKFKVYIKTNKPPGQIYLIYDPYFLEGRTGNTFYGKEDYLSYLFHDRIGINHLFKNETGFHQYETYIPLIRYIGYKEIFFDHVLGTTIADARQKRNIEFGINIFDFKWGQEKAPITKWSAPLETNLKLVKIQYVDSFKTYCDQNNIKLHLFYPPQSWPSYKLVSDATQRKLKSYAQKQGLEFVDFNKELYNDSTLFYNHMHLNKKGSTLFTAQLMQQYFGK